MTGRGVEEAHKHQSLRERYSHLPVLHLDYSSLKVAPKEAVACELRRR